MIKKILLSLCIFLTAPLLMGATAIVKTITMSSNVYGPYKILQSDQAVTVKVNWRSSQDTVQEILECGSSSSNITYTYSAPFHTVSPREEYYRAFVLPLSDYLTVKGMYISLKIVKDSGIVLTKCEDTIYPIRIGTYDPLNYTSSYLQLTQNLICFTNQTKPTYLAEQYAFRDYLNYFNVDSYHRLDVSQYSFRYYHSRKFEIESAQMYFYDYDNIFPNLRTSGNKVVVPLKTTQTIYDVFVDFDCNFYVNPLNLDLSFDALVGYEETQYFYLPLNKIEEIQDIVFYFELKRCGSNLVTFFWKSYYINDTYMFGECSNSDYCLKGDIE